PGQLPGELAIPDAVGPFGRPLIHDGFDPGQRPVIGDAGSPGMREHRTFLHRCEVEGVPVRLDGLHPGPAGLVTASTARRAQFTPARRPYSRAHNNVRISVTSRTRSSSTSAGSTTSNRRPCAVRAASPY